MQELLGRLRALDPSASASLRVIACFDELMAGGVGTDGLLSAAAALAGHPVGVRRSPAATPIRVNPLGDRLAAADPTGIVRVVDGVTVWIESASSEPTPNEAMIVERLALALRLRYEMRDAPVRRDLAVLIDPDASTAERIEAGARRGLLPGIRYRAIAAPLFAIWTVHPRGPEDVASTPFGPVHVAIITEEAAVAAAPLGIGIPATVADLALSFRTATVALRLNDGGGAPPVRADDMGGLAEVLADAPLHARPDGDEESVARALAAHPWAATTIEALVRATSVREAARATGIHHSTMTTRVGLLADEFGYAPLEGLGRTRLTLAFFKHRLRTSHILELPAPAPAASVTVP
jgi:hypothetical protein